MKMLIGATGPALALQELLYGFIMELIFVTAARIGILAYDDTTGLCLMIIGMNATWGGIDAIVFFLINHFNYRMYRRLIIAARSDSDSRDNVMNRMMNSFDGTLIDTLTQDAERRICEIIVESELESDEGVSRDYRKMVYSSIGCFIITLLTIVPVIAPIIILDNPKIGLDVASVLASILLFFIGYRMKDYFGVSGWGMGLFLTGISWSITIIATFSGG